MFAAAGSQKAAANRSGDAGAPWRGSLTRMALALAAVALAVASLGSASATARSIALRSSPFVADGVGMKPAVETEATTEVRRSSAILNGTVNPNGSNVTKCEFDYGTTPSLGTRVQCANLPGGGEAGIPVYAVLEGLSENATYYVALTAENKNGEGVGRVERFATLPSEPKVNTEPASDIERTAAKLNGFVNPDGAEVTECFFEYGPTRTYGKTVECRALPGSGETLVPVSAEVKPLKESETYDYRLVAINAYGERFGGNEEFMTPPSAPKVHTEAAAKVTHTSAELSGTVNPNGLEVTECYFAYGTTRSYGEVIPCSPSHPGDGEVPVEVTAEPTNLKEHTLYDYVLVAKNSSSSVVLGGNEVLDTLPTKPRTLTRAAGDVGPESAVFRGVVNPNDANVTRCEFEYGTTLTFGKAAGCTPSPGAGEEAVDVDASVTGLKPETTYYVRLRAENAFGNAYGGQARFITTQAGLEPEVTKVTPAKGPSAGGTTVTVRGSNFSGATEVMFGSVPAKEFKATPDAITAVSPPETTGQVDIRVSTPFGESAISSKDRFTFGAPSIKTFTPGHGPLAGGTEVTVTGSGFSTLAGKTTIEFGSADGSGVSCSSSSTCTVFTPASGKAGGVRLGVAVGGKRQRTPHGTEFTYE